MESAVIKTTLEERRIKISSRANGGSSEALVDEFVVSGERFSSDEEREEAVNANGEEKKTKKKSKKSSPTKAPVNVLTEENSMIVDGLHITDLSDSELFSKLNEYGVDVGPIVDSTRNIYRKKLAILMRGESNFNNSQSPSKVENGVSNELNGKEEFSADEEALELSEEIHDEEPVETISETLMRKISRRSNASTSVKKVSRTATPMTLNSPSSNLPDIKTRISTSSNIRPDRFTPTPRRGIHSYKSGEDNETLRYRYRVSQNTSALSTEKEHSLMDQTDTKSSGSSSNASNNSICSKFLRLLPTIFLFFVFLATALYVYQNYAQKKEFSKLLDDVFNMAQKTSTSIIDKLSSFATKTNLPSSQPTPSVKIDSSGKH